PDVGAIRQSWRSGRQRCRPAGTGTPSCLPRADLAGPGANFFRGDWIMSPFSESAGSTGLATSTVLIVDDSVIDRHLADAIVKKLDGWKAVFASNGIEALESIGQQQPDLVLTDLLMPEMDGL